MLLHKNSRFYCGKASFELPNNCQILTVEQELYYEFGLSLTNGCNYTVDVYFTHRDEDTRAGLDHIIHDIAKNPYEILPYEKNGLHGFYSTYHAKHNSYLEYALSVDAEADDEDGEPVNTLAVEVHADSEDGIREAIEDGMVDELLESVQVG